MLDEVGDDNCVCGGSGGGGSGGIAMLEKT